MLFMLEKQALLGIVRSKSFSICQAAIDKDSQLAAAEKLPSALCTSPWLPCLRELCLPTPTRKSSGMKQGGPDQTPGVSLTAFTDMWENASADSGLLNP